MDRPARPDRLPIAESDPSACAARADEPSAALPAGGRRGWLRRTREAAWFASDEMAVPVVALAGFLIRGGVLVVTLPSVVLPSLIGLASTYAVNALGIDGRPTAWLISVITGIVIVGVVWLVVSLVVGSIIDVWLIDATRAHDPLALSRPQRLPDRWLLLEMVTMRAVWLLPLAAVLVPVGIAIYQGFYSELTAPTNLNDPIVLVVARRTALPLVLVLVTWLVTETMSAIAVRRIALGDGFVAALRGTFGQLVRQPLTSVLTLVVTTTISFAAMFVAALATAVSFGLCLDAARLPADPSLRIMLGPINASPGIAPVAFVTMAVILALAWIGSLGTAGVASAWRSAAWTEETVRARAQARASRPVVLPADGEASPSRR